MLQYWEDSNQSLMLSTEMGILQRMSINSFFRSEVHRVEVISEIIKMISEGEVACEDGTVFVDINKDHLFNIIFWLFEPK